MHVDAHAGGEEGKHQQGNESAHGSILPCVREGGMTRSTPVGHSSGARFQFLPSNDSSGWKRRL